MATKYTTEIIEQMQAEKAWNYAKAVAFAATHDLKAKSVIAKAIQLGLPYEVLAKKGPAPKRTTKAEFVAMIETATNHKLPGLEGANLEDLEKLAGWINQMLA